MRGNESTGCGRLSSRELQMPTATAAGPATDLVNSNENLPGSHFFEAEMT
jgi:hypothetical protein